MSLSRITAADASTGLTVYGGAVTASTVTRTIAGPIVRYGTYGRTSRGKLKVAPGALRFPEDLGRVKLTLEHDRSASRGHLVSVEETPDGVRAALKVSDGPEGDAALREAADRTRDGFSYDVVDAVVDGDTLTSALVIAIGQVGIPAYDDMRIDSIAASTTTPEGNTMTEEQKRRLAELRAKDNLTQAEAAELSQLGALEADNAAPTGETPAEQPAPAAPAAPAAETTQQVAASYSPVPSGVPTAGRAQVTDRGNTFVQMVEQITAALQPGNPNRLTDITAALSDITSSPHTPNIEAPAWSGELFSGQLYEPEFADLFNTGSLTNWTGQGWRFTKKLTIGDYAGDKAAIPSDTVTTETSTYEAARMAVGVDVDRKFYDFPNQGFVQSLFEQVRESWAIKLDDKVRAHVLANAVAATRPVEVTTASGSTTVNATNTGQFSASDVGATITGTGIPAGATITAVTDSDTVTISAAATAAGTVTAQVGIQSPTVLKAAARAVMDLKRRLVGRASWVVLNDEDMFDLLDVAEKDVPVFLDMFNIDPRNFRSSQNVPQGQVVAGVKAAATVRTLPGSPVRVSAQHLANGGVDEAFFGYWAIEEHHTSGIAKVTYKPA